MRKILPILTVLAVVFSLCSVPVFAEDTQYNFVALPRDSGAIPWISSGDTELYFALQDTSTYDELQIYGCYYTITYNNVLRVLPLFLVRNDTDSVQYATISRSWTLTGSSTSATATVNSGSVSQFNAYYESLGWVYDSISLLQNATVFSSLNDAVAAFSTWTPPEPEPVVSPRVTIPAGYVFYFKASTDTTANISMTYNASNISTFGQFSQSDFTQRYGTQPSLPSGTVNWAYGSPLTWALFGGFFGFTSSFTSQLDFSQSVGYYYIYNPSLSLHWTDSGTYVTNPSILVDFTAPVTDIHLIPLAVAGISYDDTGGVAGISSNGNGTIYDGVTDSSTGDTTFYDSDGNELIPPSGGLDGPSYYHSPEGIADTYNGLFSSFTDSLSSIFGGVVEAFQKLISSASSFITSLGQIFSWLPPDIVNFLTSALIVMVVAGVIKVVLP